MCDSIQFCKECGQGMEIDNTGISNHLDHDGNIDYDVDSDHVALPDEN